jgi:acyl-CoA synthetase (AMP-forming)/AMP-acid ligase II
VSGPEADRPGPGLSEEEGPELHWTSFGDLARENARRFPQHTAVVCGNTRLSYPELDARTTRLANALADLGIAQGSRVAWVGQLCHQVFELFLACGKIGAMLCPLNWRLAAAEAEFVLLDFDPSIVFWQQQETGELAESLRRGHPAAVPWIQIDGTGHRSYEALIDEAGTVDLETPVDPALPLLVIYTAAFEGRPHGAQLHHVGLLETGVVRAFLAGVSEDTVYLNATNAYHVGNWDYGMLPTFLFGGTNVFLRRWNPRAALTIIDREGVTMAFLPGPTHQAVLDARAGTGLDISTLQAPADLAARVSGYGQTELHGVQVFRGLARGATGPQGRPSPFAQVRILADSGEEIAPGEVGEICVRGNVVMSGYVGHQPSTLRRHRSRWHRTNDLGRREPDGSITFVGVKERMLKSGSENIYPAEVEACIRELDGVAECVVIGYVDPAWDQSVLAIVIPEPGMTLAQEAVIEHCRSRMASYKKPRRVLFVDELPRVNGRYDFDQIHLRYEGGGYPGASPLTERQPSA